MNCVIPPSSCLMLLVLLLVGVPRHIGLTMDKIKRPYSFT